MADLRTINGIKGELLIQKFGNLDFTTFSSVDSYGNTRYLKANELNPNSFYVLHYRKDEDNHPIQELNLISNQTQFKMWFR